MPQAQSLPALSFFIWLKRSRFSFGSRHRFGPLRPAAAVLYWPLTLLFLGFIRGWWGDTCRVLTATWQNTFLKSCCKDGGPPNRNHRGAQRPCRGVMHVFASHPFPHWTQLWCLCVFVCACQAPIDWELNLCSRGKCGPIEDAADRFRYSCRQPYLTTRFFFFFCTHYLKITLPPYAPPWRRRLVLYWCYRAVRSAEAMQIKCNYREIWQCEGEESMRFILFFAALP